MTVVLRSLLLVLLLTSGGGQAAITSITVFGDSLSDTGNIAGLAELFGLESPTPPPYFNGRFSNGPVYAERLGFEALPTFQLGGSNYAVGGALTSSHVGGPLLSALSLQGQVGTFRTTTGGAADPNSLFILWIGGNDVREAARVSDPAEGASLIGDALEVLEMAVLDLQEMGARRIVIPNLPDIGRTPEFLADPMRASALTAQWNAGVEELVSGSQGSLDLFNVHALFEEVLGDPAAYGFTNTTGQAILNLDQDPDQFVFWDDLHPTARVHGLLADELRVLVPEPSALLLLAVGVLSLLRRRCR